MLCDEMKIFSSSKNYKADADVDGLASSKTSHFLDVELFK